MLQDMEPVIVNGIDITQVEGADIKIKSDVWYHEKEMNMIGENDEKTSKHLIDFLNKQGYELPNFDLNQIIQNYLNSK